MPRGFQQRDPATRINEPLDELPCGLVPEGEPDETNVLPWVIPPLPIPYFFDNFGLGGRHPLLETEVRFDAPPADHDVALREVEHPLQVPPAERGRVARRVVLQGRVDEREAATHEELVEGGVRRAGHDRVPVPVVGHGGPREGVPVGVRDADGPRVPPQVEVLALDNGNDASRGAGEMEAQAVLPGGPAGFPEGGVADELGAELEEPAREEALGVGGGNGGLQEGVEVLDPALVEVRESREGSWSGYRDGTKI